VAGPLAQAVRSIMTSGRSSGRLENALMEEAAGTGDTLVLLLGFVFCQGPCL